MSKSHSQWYSKNLPKMLISTPCGIKRNRHGATTKNQSYIDKQKHDKQKTNTF